MDSKLIILNWQLARLYFVVLNVLLNNLLSFDKDELIQLFEYYSKNFKAIEILALEEQTYIIDMRTCKDFEGLRGLNDLTENLVVTTK